MDQEQRAHELLEIEVSEAWEALVSHPAGRLVIWSILDKCGCFNFDHFGGEADLINKGRQQIGGEILRDHVFPFGMRAYTDLLLEAEERDKRLIDAGRATDIDNEAEGQT